MMQLPPSGFVWCLVGSSVAHILVVGIVMTEVGGAILPASGRIASGGAGGPMVARLIEAEAPREQEHPQAASAEAPSIFPVKEEEAIDHRELIVARPKVKARAGRIQAALRVGRSLLHPPAPFAGRVAENPSHVVGAAAGASPGTVGDGAGGVDAPPELLTSDNPAPEYPEEARLAHHEGRVRVLVTISEDGVVQEEKVVASSTFEELDRAALRAIRQWHFRPARRFGLPVSSQMTVPVVFRIEEE